MGNNNIKDTGPFYHGTKAVLGVGDFLKAGHQSNYSEQLKSSYVYLTATLDAAIWEEEVLDWQSHTTDKVYTMRENLKT